MNAKFDYVSKFFPRLMSHIDVIIFYLGRRDCKIFEEITGIFFAVKGGRGSHILSLTFTKTKLFPMPQVGIKFIHAQFSAIF